MGKFNIYTRIIYLLVKNLVEHIEAVGERQEQIVVPTLHRFQHFTEVG